MFSTGRLNVGGKSWSKTGVLQQRRHRGVVFRADDEDAAMRHELALELDGILGRTGGRLEIAVIDRHRKVAQVGQRGFQTGVTQRLHGLPGQFAVYRIVPRAAREHQNLRLSRSVPHISRFQDI